MEPVFEGLPDFATPRLQLRRFGMQDASRVQQLAGDWRVACTTAAVPHPYADGVAEQWIAGQPSAWAERGVAVWAIDLRDGPLVGCVSLMVNRKHNKADFGYWIGFDFWGKGYCTEAARPVLAFGFDVLRLGRIGAVHLVENPASGRVMQKLGMTYEGVQRHFHLIRGEPRDAVNYGMLPNDPRPAARS